jgi:hypothetical protein
VAAENKAEGSVTMKGITSCAIIAALFAMTPHAYGESELSLNQTLEPFVLKTYGHQYSVVLAAGFWAKAGSDVTVTVGNGLLQTLSGVVKVEPARLPEELVPYSGGAATDNVLVEVGTNVELPNPTSYYAVDGIGIREQDDQPCYLSLWGRMVDPRYRGNLAGRKVGEFQLAKCNVKPEKKFLKGKDVSVGELDLTGGFIRSARVCQYGGPIGGGIDAGELKGIRILPAIVSRSGDIIPKDLKPEEQPTLVQPHCAKDVILANDQTGSASGWDHWVSCPADQVVTGLQVYHREKQITALDVRCKRVGWLTAPKEPVRDLLGY